jgi:hypothetical protein
LDAKPGYDDNAVYRCIFMSWQLFATLTVTAFVFLVVTTVMGIA